MKGAGGTAPQPGQQAAHTRFQKKAKKLELPTAEECSTRARDETTAMADVRLRKGARAPKKKRAVYEHAVNRAKVRQSGLLAADGKSRFERRERFTKDDFVEFLRNAHAKFSRTVVMPDGAPWHWAKAVRDAMDGMNGGVKLACLPPGRPDLAATGEAWRQMKRAVPSGPYVKSSKMRRDVKLWPRDYIPRPDVFRRLYRSG